VLQFFAALTLILVCSLPERSADYFLIDAFNVPFRSLFTERFDICTWSKFISRMILAFLFIVLASEQVKSWECFNIALPHLLFFRSWTLNVSIDFRKFVAVTFRSLTLPPKHFQLLSEFRDGLIYILTLSFSAVDPTLLLSWYSHSFHFCSLSGLSLVQMSAIAIACQLPSRKALFFHHLHPPVLLLSLLLSLSLSLSLSLASFHPFRSHFSLSFLVCLSSFCAKSHFSLSCSNSTASSSSVVHYRRLFRVTFLSPYLQSPAPCSVLPASSSHMFTPTVLPFTCKSLTVPAPAITFAFTLTVDQRSITLSFARIDILEA
jgi:hypothetical protein